MEQQTKRPARTWWRWLAVVVVSIMIGVGLVWFTDRPEPTPAAQTAGPANQQQQLQNLHTDFPLLYPANLPAGFSVVPNSVTSYEGSAMFSLAHGDSRVTVTQQPRPKIIEEVDKIKDVEVASGKAYIADLEDRLVGFLLTDTTLTMVSATKQLEAEVLADLLASLAPL